ncbi:MAG: hypothetical protein Q9M91_08455 [Candidatus Dojkabacteria bacterium]|nr:hypothetical protein [Candidatus Dojkabacteria bacterium]MDQ7021803.1 hypothetical protein [Candidatus Dojkabacteria bacterium]
MTRNNEYDNALLYFYEHIGYDIQKETYFVKKRGQILSNFLKVFLVMYLFFYFIRFSTMDSYRWDVWVGYYFL